MLPNSSPQADEILPEKPNLVLMWSRSPEGFVPGETLCDSACLASPGKADELLSACVRCPVSGVEEGFSAQAGPAVPADLWPLGSCLGPACDRQTLEVPSPCQSGQRLCKT